MKKRKKTRLKAKKKKKKHYQKQGEGETIIYLLDRARSFKERKHIQKNVFSMVLQASMLTTNTTQYIMESGHIQPGRCCHATEKEATVLRK